MSEDAHLQPEATRSRRLEADFFRHEVETYRRDRLGVPILLFGTSTWWHVGLLSAMAALIVLFFATAQFPRKETVAGVLVPSVGAVQVVAPRAGVVAERRVQEGQQIMRDQPMFIVSSDAVVSGGRGLGRLLSDASNSEGAALTEQLAASIEEFDAQINEVEERLSGLALELATLAEQRALQVRRIQLSREGVEAARTLHDRQLLAGSQLRQREEQLLSVEQQLLEQDRTTGRLASERDQLRARLAQLEAQRRTVQAQNAQAAAQLNQRQASDLNGVSQVVLAPISGTVTGIAIAQGASTQTGAPLAIILPAGSELEVELWVPSRAVGLIEKGMAVRLKFDAFPSAKFGMGRGTVQEIGKAPTLPSTLFSGSDVREPMYRVVVAIEKQSMDGYGRTWALAPGMRLSADILLERRSLIDWLLTPVAALRAA